ncbi:hypothetical protein PSYMO_31462, partial [Pseudomonas amygdali pv. mori str. 301020]
MANKKTDKYSAGEQGLGYIYQARLALLHLLQLPEDSQLAVDAVVAFGFDLLKKSKRLADTPCQQ